MPAPESGVPGTTTVRDAHRFDEKRLQSFLDHYIESSGKAFVVSQFEGGQSNPTFLLQYGDERYVLRKKPPGKLLPSAHQIEREFRIINALQKTPVKVPQTIVLCEDDGVIGTSFYVMKYVSGRIFRDTSLPNMDRTERAAVYDSMNRTLADLHNIDWQNLDLADFGKKESYLARQVSRWTKQYQSAQTETIETMDRLIQWLPANVPSDDLSGAEATITHGDFRIENLIFDEKTAAVKAVLDWELSTIGHPLADLGYCLAAYHLPADLQVLPGLKGLDLESLGIPSETEFIRLYCQRTGRTELPEHKFFVVFSLFRLASIAQGVLARARQGTASSERAHAVGRMARMLADQAWQLVNE